MSTISQRFPGFLPVGVVDVETGGFNPATDALLGVAAIFVRQNDAGDLELGEHHCSLVKPFPGSKLEPASLEVTGIDPFHPLRPALDEEEALKRLFKEIREELKKHDLHARGPRRAQLVLRLAVLERGRRAHEGQAQPVPPFLELRYGRRSQASPTVKPYSGAPGRGRIDVGRGTGALGALRRRDTAQILLQNRESIANGL